MSLLRGSEPADAVIASLVRIRIELLLRRAESRRYLASRRDHLERLLSEMPPGSLTADEFLTLRNLVASFKEPPFL